MEKLLSTAELCDLLDVSRSWVNRNLRHLGYKGIDQSRGYKDLNAVFYDAESVLKWFNEHAVFSRQSILADWAEYTEEEELDRRFEKVLKMPRGTYEEKMEAAAEEARIYQELLPEAVRERVITLYDKRMGRKAIPWVRVEYAAQRLQDVFSVKEIMIANGWRSNELVYRYMISAGYIRAKIDGRSWFIAPEQPREDKDWSKTLVLIATTEKIEGRITLVDNG